MAGEAKDTAWGPLVRVAIEQWEPIGQRLVHDQVAHRFLPRRLRAFVLACRFGPVRRTFMRTHERVAPGITGGILCRKRYIDDKMAECLQGGIRHVAILGAGFDTRAFRWPALSAQRVLEVDLPVNVAAKREAIQRVYGQVPAHLELIPLDLETQDLSEVFRQTGERPVLAICEGVSQYLSRSGFGNVLVSLRQAPEGSRLAFTYILRSFLDGVEDHGLGIVHRQVVRRGLWRYGIKPDEIGRLLAIYGWTVREHIGFREYEERYLKPLGRAISAMPIERMVWAEKRVA